MSFGPAALAEDAGVAFCPAGPFRTAVVAQVLDGDTLQLADGTVVRLAGIAAPKRPLEVSPDSPWLAGAAAAAVLEDLIGAGAVTLAPTDEEPDRYGRMVAQVRLPHGTWLQQALLRRGMARVTGQASELPCFSVLLQAEADARTHGRGLWRTQEYAVKAADDPSLTDRKGLYEIVEGRVVSVGHGRRMIFLDFGSDYRLDFTVMVSPALAETFAEAGVAMDGLEGRRVRVRGVIEESGGPAIRIGHPAELELLDD